MYITCTCIGERNIVPTTGSRGNARLWPQNKGITVDKNTPHRTYNHGDIDVGIVFIFKKKTHTWRINAATQVGIAALVLDKRTAV